MFDASALEMRNGTGIDLKRISDKQRIGVG
jgi:hypothetical protein